MSSKYSEMLNIKAAIFDLVTCRDVIILCEYHVKISTCKMIVSYLALVINLSNPEQFVALALMICIKSNDSP
jgi:hypothetical protein